MFVVSKCCGNEHTIIGHMCTIGTVPYVDIATYFMFIFYLFSFAKGKVISNGSTLITAIGLIFEISGK